ncbi:hypothetical protein G6F68_020658 [Rhizopus microsporus]|nr:hypothetical protein G6F68_020658 [Rhizopus microsporus]
MLVKDKKELGKLQEQKLEERKEHKIEEKKQEIPEVEVKEEPKVDEREKEATQQESAIKKPFEDKPKKFGLPVQPRITPLFAKLPKKAEKESIIPSSLTATHVGILLK